MGLNPGVGCILNRLISVSDVAAECRLAALALPEHVRHASLPVECSRHDEQEIGQAVEILQRDRGDWLRTTETGKPSFRTAADRARQVTICRGA